MLLLHHHRGLATARQGARRGRVGGDYKEMVTRGEEKGTSDSGRECQKESGVRTSGTGLRL